MFDWISNIVALIMNPVSLLLFLIIIKYMKRERKKHNNQWWASHQGRAV